MKWNESRHLMHIFLVIFLVFQLFFSSLLVSCQEETVLEDFIICRSCGHDISLTNFIVNKHSPKAIGFSNQTLSNGKEVTVQDIQNPLGLRFRVFIVQQAYCAKIEEWISEHSWFPGYSWKLCVCPKCRTHLGWMFEPTETATGDNYFPSKKGFYALIYNRVISEEYVNSLLIREKTFEELEH